MSKAQELIDAAKPPEMNERRKQLRIDIEAARNRRMEEIPVDVLIGDVAAKIVLTELWGHEWNNLACTFPREGNQVDAAVRCNSDVLLEGYPTDRITIDGEHPTPEEWIELVRLLPAPCREDIVIGLWGVHIHRPEQQLARLLAEEKEKTNG
ncbi:hypothetical protein [Microbacterium sp.]|uniref:hypothetical protein n=1 Tax=Actinomycetes TaxID=1760 RepID=UPI0037C559CE